MATRFTHPELWRGGHYELVIDRGARDDAQTRTALSSETHRLPAPKRRQHALLFAAAEGLRYYAATG